MNSVPLTRLFELMQAGVYSGCLAVITDEVPTEEMISSLSGKARQHYRTVNLWNLSSEGSLNAFPVDAELILVFGLERHLPDSPVTYQARTKLDVRRNSGLFSMICLDQASFRCHFNNSEKPFYNFCDSIYQKSISDWI